MRQPSGELIAEQIRQTIMQARPFIGKRVVPLLCGFDAGRVEQRLDELLSRMEQPLRLGIIGEFRSGKSSLVNALAQAKVALTDEVEATATLNRYYYSEKEHAIITYTDGRAEHVSIPEALRLLDERRHDTEWLHTVKQVDIGYPVPFLKEIELWDTPGLGGSDLNRQIAQRFSLEVDAVIWVFDVNTLGRQDIGDVLTDIDARDKLTLGVLNKSENLSTQEAKRARNFVREIYPHVNFVEILPFSAMLAMHTCGLVEEEPFAWGDAVPPDGGREQLVQLIHQYVLQDPRRVALQAVLADCVVFLDEIADELHVNFLYRQRQRARYEQAISAGSQLIAKRFQELQSDIEQHIEIGLRQHLYGLLHKEIEANRSRLQEGKLFARVMRRVLHEDNIKRPLESMLHQQEPRIQLVIQELGIECDRALDRLLTPVEKVEFQRATEAAIAIPNSPASVSAKRTDDPVAVATSVTALFTILFNPPLWVVPLAWVASGLLYSSIVNRPQSDVVAERKREGEQAIDSVLRDQILPKAKRVIQEKIQSVQDEMEQGLHNFWRQRLLGHNTVEEVETMCANLLTTYQQFREWSGNLQKLSTVAGAGRAMHKAGHVAAADKETVRTILETILDEGRRTLWVLDMQMSPQVLQWLENAHPSASLRLLTAGSRLNDTSVLLFEQAIRTLRQNRQGAVNMGILRDSRVHVDPAEPPFSGSWILTERGSYYFSVPIVDVLSRSRDFDFEPVTSDTLPQRRVTAETFEKWWFNRDKYLPMLPVFLKEQMENK